MVERAKSPRTNLGFQVILLAQHLWKARETQIHSPCKNVVVASAMMGVGRGVLSRGIMESEADTAKLGVGAIVLGSIIHALWQGTVNNNGWDVSLVRNNIKIAYQGLPFNDRDKENVEDSWAEEDFMLLNPADCKEIGLEIRDILSKNDTFLSFFEQDFEELPIDLRTYLAEYPDIGKQIMLALPLYAEAIANFEPA